MSWLIPLFLAGAMFASTDAGNQPPIDFKYENKQVKTIVQADETERFEQTYPLNASGKVAVSNVNGSVTIDVWDSPQVKLEYVKTADSREHLAEIEIKIDARADAFEVETNFEKWKRNEDRTGRGNRNNRFEVQYHLTVPRTAILEEIATVNGAVNIRDAGSLVKASTVNGEVNATNLRGAAANLSTVNGAVNADFDALAAGSRITLNAVNGTVTLTIPSDASATVRADTLNGSIVNDFNLPVRKGEFVGRDLYGKLGAGDARIKLSSVNGSLTLKRKNDGKTPSAATSLLSSKNYEDSDEWDDDDDEKGNAPRVKPPRPPKPPRPANAPNAPNAPLAPNVVIDNEMIRKSIEDAQRELSALKPNLGKISEDALREAAAQMNSPEVRAQLKAAQEKYKDAFAMMANANWGAPRVEEKSESFAVEGVPRVTIEAGNCAVVVRGWDKREVRYAATRVSKSSAPLDLKATRDGSKINIKVLNGSGENKNDGDKSQTFDYYFADASRARIEIFVPRKSDLKIKTAGEIRLEGVSGEIDLQGAGESINVRDADGKLSVASGNGAIRVIGFRGVFDGKTGDGAMNLEGDFASLNALAEQDGTIVLTLSDNANAVIDASAEIENDGADLVRENAREKLWRAGTGGAIYRLSVAESGKIVVRGASALKN